MKFNLKSKKYICGHASKIGLGWNIKLSGLTFVLYNYYNFLLLGFLSPGMF